MVVYVGYLPKRTAARNAGRADAATSKHARLALIRSGNVRRASSFGIAASAPVRVGGCGPKVLPQSVRLLRQEQ
jgi:hypothetical protein